MSKSVNKVLLLGNVGKDAEIKSLPSGATVANFSLATTERYKDKSGEWQDRTEWHNLVAYQRTAEVIRDYTEKGSKVFIEGRLTTRSWDDKDSGKKVYRTEIVVLDISLLSGRNGSNGDDGNGDRNSNREKAGARSSSRSQRGYDNSPDNGLGIDDSDIPF
jgi:single-strand DNA-binding protein